MQNAVINSIFHSADELLDSMSSGDNEDVITATIASALSKFCVRRGLPLSTAVVALHTAFDEVEKRARKAA